MGQFIEISAADGAKCQAYRAEPAGKPRGGIVVIQEIFGVNKHIKSVADGYAADGYLVVAPAMFDRAQARLRHGYSQPEIQAGIAIMQKLDWKQTMQDAAAAIGGGEGCGQGRHRRLLLGRHGRLGSGGALSGLACAVPYYGGGMPGFIGEKPRCQPKCPRWPFRRAGPVAHPDEIGEGLRAATRSHRCTLRRPGTASTATSAVPRIRPRRRWRASARWPSLPSIWADFSQTSGAA
jgi:hypothetical protein